MGRQGRRWTQVLRTPEAQAVLGTFVYTPSGDVLGAIGQAGLDFVVLDLEHGAYGMDRLPDLIALAHAADLWTLVRVAEGDVAAVGHVLDFGADGVLVPHVGSSAAAELAVQAAAYAPRGRRSLFPFGRAAAYGALGAVRWSARAHEQQSVAVLLEGTTAFEALEAVLRVDGLDLAFAGPLDLSQDLGVPGQARHPAVQAHLAQLAGAAQAHNKAAGVFCADPDDLRRYVAMGFRVIAYGVDVAVLHGTYAEINQRFRSTPT